MSNPEIHNDFDTSFERDDAIDQNNDLRQIIKSALSFPLVTPSPLMRERIMLIVRMEEEARKASALQTKQIPILPKTSSSSQKNPPA